MRIKIFLFFSTLYFFSILHAQNAPITVTDLLKIRSLSGVTLNASGTQAAFTVTTIEPDGDKKWEYKYVNQVWITGTDGSANARRLTYQESTSQPAWSPDGRQLAMTRTVDLKPQIFLLSLDGGEPVQITNYKYGASSPKWSPDGKQILFSSAIPLSDLLKDSLLNPWKEIPKWPFEKPGFSKNENLEASTAKADPDGGVAEVRAWLALNETDKKAKVLDKLQFQEESTTSSEISFNQFFIVDAKAGASVKPLTHGFSRFNSVEFSSDGKKLILSGDVDSLQHPDRSLENEIFVANADGSDFKKLLGEEGKVFGNPKLSPSGKWLSFTVGSTSFVTVPQLAMVPAQGSIKDAVYIPFDRNANNFQWSADEKWLYFTAPSNGGFPLYRLNVDSKKIQQLTDFNSGVTSFDLENGVLVFVKTEVASPFELWKSTADLSGAARITNINTDWIRERKLSLPEKHVFKNDKGMEIEYWVMKPSNYEAGKKYPVLLDIHGGPSAMWGPGEASMWHEFQFFCSKGYGVVYCNPRGSGGYGVNFLKGNLNDWGKGPTSDVLTALDKAVAEGWADTSKLVVSGGSYAGYLVAWIVGHDHRFKAACSQRGVYDLNTFFGEGNAWRLVPNYFGGYPWDEKAKPILTRESPITYVNNITTPYIMFHGENDLRTGTIQGEMLYKSLKVLNRPVEYVRHPGATHEITRSGNNRQRMDQMLRTWEFFERYLHTSN